jgi:hypothetical protein
MNSKNKNPAVAYLVIAALVVVVAYLMFRQPSQPPPPAKPPMPVSVSFRTATFGSGLVAQFKNTSSRYLTVVLYFENRTLHQSTNGYIELTPLDMKEIGWAEGWKFMSGEYIVVSHEDYSTLSVRVP